MSDKPIIVWRSLDEIIRIPPPHQFCFLGPPVRDAERGIIWPCFPCRHYFVTEICPRCGTIEEEIYFPIIHPFLPPLPLKASMDAIIISLIGSELIKPIPDHRKRYHVSCPYCGFHEPRARWPDTAPMEILIEHWPRVHDVTHLTPMQGDLYALLAQHGPLSSREIARALGVSIINALNNCRFLRNKGLVVRTASGLFRLATAQERAEILRRPLHPLHHYNDRDPHTFRRRARKHRWPSSSWE